MSASGPSSRHRTDILALLSLVGLFVSLWTTRYKFRADYLGDTTGCTGDAQAGWLSCDEALSSSWSMVGSIPLTVLSAALFIVVLALWMILRGRGAAADAAHAVLILVAALALVICVALASYSLMFFTHLCPYCLTLYVVSGALLALAGPRREDWQQLGKWSRGVARGSRAPIDTALFAGTLFTFAVGAQMVAYRHFAESAKILLPADPPPTPSIRHRLDGAPREVVMLFIDPTCPICRNEIQLIHQSLAKFLRGSGSRRWHGVELWAFPIPLAACDPRRPSGWFVDREGQPLSNSDAEFHGACVAARALECVAMQAPEHAFDALELFYEFHDTQPPFFNYKKISSGLKSSLTAVSLDMAALQRCVDGQQSLARITEYQEWFARWCQQRPSCGLPQALVVPLEAGVPRIDLGNFANTAEQIFQTLDTSPFAR